MPFCLCGSQKKAGAVDFLNTNDIGALCFLFGAEGSLCRLLDLIPDAIAKVVTLNPDFSNAGDVFQSILKKVAKKSFNLIIDEITGQIPTAQFCQNEPPPEPEPITYYDVYEFIAQVVPILNLFFSANDVLTGNETKLLDKIVGTWLRQKWFENCECKEDCQDPPPPPPPKINCDCPPGSIKDPSKGMSFGYVVKAGPGTIIPGTNPPRFYPSDYTFINWTVISLSGSFSVGKPVRPDGTLGATWLQSKENYWVGHYEVPVIENPTEYVYNTVNGKKFDKGGLPTCSDFAVSCIPIPPPPPPAKFCDLYPNDPLCRVSGCTDPKATNYNPKATFDDGSCTYTELGGCTNRYAKNYNPKATFDDGSCDYTGGGCTDPNATNYDPQASYDNGTCYYDQPIGGCTDPNAENYNPDADFDDGSCTYACPDDSCKIDCPDDPSGFCCIETAFLSRLHNLVLQ